MVTSLNTPNKCIIRSSRRLARASIATTFAIPRFGMREPHSLCSAAILATAMTKYFAQRAYRIPYQLVRLAKVLGVSAFTYLAMMLATPASSWQTLVLRAGLVLLFPVGLLVLRFFEPHELAEIRKLLESQTFAAVPTDG